MEQKAVLVLSSVAVAGLAIAGVILAVRMPEDAVPGAFAVLVNASTRGMQGIPEACTC